jgi:hypothetical protein
VRRQQQPPHARAPGCHGNREHAANAVDGTVERQFAEDHGIVDGPSVQLSRGGEQSERNGQVEGRACLADIGGREVDRDAVGRELEARVSNGGPHAIAALANGRVGQTDHGEVGEAERYVDLDMHRVGVHAEDRSAP